MNFHIYFEKFTDLLFKKKIKPIDISKIKDVKRSYSHSRRYFQPPIGRKYLPNSQSELDEIHRMVEWVFSFGYMNAETGTSSPEFDFISFKYKSWFFSPRENYFIDLLTVNQELRALNISKLLEDNS
jgi:hypothetical protein